MTSSGIEGDFEAKGFIDGDIDIPRVMGLKVKSQDGSQIPVL